MDAAAVMGLQVHGALCEPTVPPLAQSVQPRWQRGERGSVARVDKLQWRQFTQVRFSSKLRLKPSSQRPSHPLQSRLHIDVT